ncbi:hypothetical protein BJY52DRAFT_615746 [Lactarius psammicola]|nr:hypothetical protein BJY52DRAFT_615746 [Lactarius psammicola]
MNLSQANSREYQRQAIDAEIKTLEESIRALRLRRNALVPVSSLPPEVIAAIFTFLRLRFTSAAFTLGEKTNTLPWLHVAHVCHRWREIALNQSPFWSHVDFTTLTSAGAAEILARAKKAPLHLEARFPIGHWDDARFSTFQKELQPRVSHICHLGISAGPFNLRRILGGLASPAPALEYLSLSNEKYQNRALLSSRALIPNNIFDGTTPRLSCLVLCNCNISWTSPLLKGLKNLEIITLSENMRPSLTIWLDALDEMPQLETLILHSATPIAPPFPYDVERTVTLPFLTHIDISASVRDCAVALAHLNLPALTRLYLVAKSHRWNGGDVQEIFPHLARHAGGPQDTQPLQSMLIRGDRTRADMFAWNVPDIDSEVRDSISLVAATLYVRIALSITSKDWFLPETHTGILDAAMAALPLDNLVTLTAQNLTRLDEQVWRRHAPRWPLLQCVRLAPPAARGFREMLLNDKGGRECPLLPSLRKLVLVSTGLSARRTLRLCDTLMQRVEQGVPLETLDLRACFWTSHAVRLLSEVVVDVSGVEGAFEETLFTTDTTARGYFVHDDDSGAEDYLDDYDYDDPDSSSDHVDEDDDEDDEDDGDDDDEEVEDYREMEEDQPSS